VSLEGLYRQCWEAGERADRFGCLSIKEREHKKVHVSATREAREQKAKTTQVR
jgi:hypothetical protein